MKKNSPLVSVFMICYNQENYILEALESVLNQTVNFPYQIILSDDCSIDKTKKKITNFLKDHPKKNLVKFISQEKNIGWMPNFIFTLQKCKETGSKYIAMCEGDDFWTDKNKLQKQVNILEENQDIVLSCHRYKELYNDGKTNECPYFRKDFFEGKNYFEFDQKDFEEFMRIQTMTIVFRSYALNLDLRYKYQYYCDTHIKHHILDHGLGYYSIDSDAIYRIHGNNVFMSLSDRKKNKFSYDVYKDLITNNKSIRYKPLMMRSMRERIKNELQNKKLNFLDRYYLGLLIEQFKYTKSIPLLIKNLLKGATNF